MLERNRNFIGKRDAKDTARAIEKHLTQGLEDELTHRGKEKMSSARWARVILFLRSHFPGYKFKDSDSQYYIEMIEQKLHDGTLLPAPTVQSEPKEPHTSLRLRVAAIGMGGILLIGCTGHLKVHDVVSVPQNAVKDIGLTFDAFHKEITNGVNQLNSSYLR